VAAQRLWWQRSNGGAAMGRSDGRKGGNADGRDGGSAAIAMTAQRWLGRFSDGNGDGGAVMGVAVVVAAAAAAAVAVVRCPPFFACGCSSATPDGTPTSLVTC